MLLQFSIKSYDMISIVSKPIYQFILLLVWLLKIITFSTFWWSWRYGAMGPTWKKVHLHVIH